MNEISSPLLVNVTLVPPTRVISSSPLPAPPAVYLIIFLFDVPSTTDVV